MEPSNSGQVPIFRSPGPHLAPGCGLRRNDPSPLQEASEPVDRGQLQDPAFRLHGKSERLVPGPARGDQDCGKLETVVGPAHGGPAGFAWNNNA